MVRAVPVYGDVPEEEDRDRERAPVFGGEESLVVADDSLRSLGSTRYDMVLTNPPFGKKSLYTVLGVDGLATSGSQTYESDDFWPLRQTYSSTFFNMSRAS